ncbi:VOC family protein [Streptomyces sp. PT12]|uniref:VOC family protein n=1 Tax=Streptomyces sp. PT12 TaxID=1510197 RepID=UPI00215C5272|nr:VOC family protein [Streptomyces sp. PT12]
MISTSRLGASRDFYASLFGFKVTHETEWHADLVRPGLPPQELTLVDPSHPAVRGVRPSPMRTVRMTLEADVEEGELRRSLTRLGWDERLAFRFSDPESNDLIVVDPNGVRIHVVASA